MIISDATLPTTTSISEYFPLSLSPFSRNVRIERSFRHLDETLRKGLSGSLGPAIYLFSASCGLGKSKNLQAFIRGWKSDGLRGGGSILLALATHAEIESFIDDCRLEHTDYAVYTSDPRSPSWGVGKASAGEAKMLFTTHEQLTIRTSEYEQFGEVGCFHYRGKPRTLRVWDEGLLPALYASFQLNAMRSLPYAIGSNDAALASAIAKLLPAEDELAVGQTVAIPTALGLMIREYGRRCEAMESGQKGALEGLRKLAGYDAVIRKDNLHGWVLVGTGKPLPRDLAPMIAMDASAPLMNRYDDWSRYGFKIVKLLPAQVRYDNAVLFWWDRGCGKTTLNKLSDRNEIFSAVADLINDKADERWLVIHHKGARRSGERDGELPRDLCNRLNKPANVSSLHWGLHRATNAYRDVQNVIVLGALEYGEGAYEAIGMAASGRLASALPADFLTKTRDGEVGQNLYQAVCRSNIRNADEGVCGRANVYLVMPASSQRKAIVEGAFPGCSIQDWQPTPAKKMTKVDLVQSVLLSLLASSSQVSFKAVRVACDQGHNESYLSKVSKDARFVAFMKANRIARAKNSFVRYHS